MLRSIPCVVLALAAAPAALAQDFNLDLLNNFGNPSNTYGAAAGQTGFWQNLDAFGLLGPQAVNDVNNAPTSVTVDFTDGFNFSFDNAATTGDDQALLDDLQCINLGSTWTISGLAAGSYQVFAYSWAPDVPTSYVTDVTVVGGSAGLQSCGAAAWTGAHVDGGTYVDDVVTVPAGGSIVIDFAVGSGFGSVNGVQLVHGGGGPTPPTPYCPPSSPGTTNGCLPTIAATAAPNVSHTSGCTITVSNVEGQKNGIVFYGLASTSTPWCAGGNSFLCVKAPTQRTGSQSTGGTMNLCDGTLTLNWDAYQLSHPGALGQPWMAGDHAFVQGWFRDPPACKTTFLPEALDLTYAP
jgi:hypothetical protein